MKTNKFIYLLLGIIVVSFIGCKQKNESIEKPIIQNSENKINIVFVTTYVNEDFFKPVKKGMRDAANLMGVNCSFIGTESVDVVAQAKMMEKAVEAGADGIALNIIDTLAFDAVIKKTMDKGIPVVAFNIDDNVSPNARLSGVNQNLFKAGQLLGEKMLHSIPEKSTVLITMHSEGISALDDRRRGVESALKKKNIKSNVVITGATAEIASKVISDAVIADPTIKTILSTGLVDTEGSGLAIENNSFKRKINAAGFDLSNPVVRHIKKGHLVFTIDQQPYMQGFLPVVQLVLNIKYGIVPSNNEIGAAFVTKNNVEKVEKLIIEGYR